MIITLIGFMGCGKSTVGEGLAEALGKEFIDLDKYIEEEEGVSIPFIFENMGESVFRVLELTALVEIMGNIGDCVVALGGGTVTDPNCLKLLKNSTFNIYLKASAATIVSHLEGETEGRPLLKGEEALPDKVERLYGERKALYEEAASLTIDIDGKSADAVIDEILDSLEK